MNEKPFYLSATFEEEDFKIMQNIAISKPAGIDNLSGKCLKDRAEILARPLSKICTLSITSRMFSTAGKFSRLKPIFKKGKKN